MLNIVNAHHHGVLASIMYKSPIMYMYFYHIEKALDDGKKALVKLINENFHLLLFAFYHFLFCMMSIE